MKEKERSTYAISLFYKWENDAFHYVTQILAGGTTSCFVLFFAPLGPDMWWSLIRRKFYPHHIVIVLADIVCLGWFKMT